MKEYHYLRSGKKMWRQSFYTTDSENRFCRDLNFLYCTEVLQMTNSDNLAIIYTKVQSGSEYADTVAEKRVNSL